MGDPYGLALQQQTDEVERSLEMCMPEDELPKVEEMVQMTSNAEPLSNKAKDRLTSSMEHTAKAHFHATQAAEEFIELSRTCTPAQLMVIIKYAS